MNILHVLMLSLALVGFLTALILIIDAKTNFFKAFDARIAKAEKENLN